MADYLDGIPVEAWAKDEDGTPIFDQFGDREFCLDHHKGGCSGAVIYRYPLSGTGKSFVRCDHHWAIRCDEQDRINRKYPQTAPRDFDPSYAGESWDEDY
jgi:hypothetical protein